MVIAIIAILAAILFPVFAQAKKAAKSIASVSNLKQTGTAFKLYSGDNEDAYPAFGGQDNGCIPNVQWGTAAGGWAYLIYPYSKNGEIAAVPASTKPFWLGEGSWGSCGGAPPANYKAMSDDFNNKAKSGVQYMYRKAFGGAGATSDYAGGPITDTQAANPANNIVNFEYAAWSTDPMYHIWGQYPAGQLGNLALNVSFMDGHAKKIRGTQFRGLRYNVSGEGDAGNGRLGNTKNGMNMDWFIGPDDGTGHVDTYNSPSNDTKDVD